MSLSSVAWLGRARTARRCRSRELQPPTCTWSSRRGNACCYDYRRSTERSEVRLRRWHTQTADTSTELLSKSCCSERSLRRCFSGLMNHVITSLQSVLLMWRRWRSSTHWGRRLCTVSLIAWILLQRQEQDGDFIYCMEQRVAYIPPEEEHSMNLKMTHRTTKEYCNKFIRFIFPSNPSSENNLKFHKLIN